MTLSVSYPTFAVARRRLEDSVILIDKEPSYIQSLRQELGGGADEVVFLPGEIYAGRMYLNPNWGTYADTPRRAKESLEGVVAPAHYFEELCARGKYTEFIEHYNTRTRQLIGREEDVNEHGPFDTSKTVLNYTNIERQENTSIPLASPLLDLTPVPLGMVNKPGGTYYVQRGPVRRYSQGLTTSNIITYPLGTTQGIGRVYLDRDVDFVSCIKGRYPSLKDCLRDFAGSEREIQAFSRDLAIEMDPKLGLAFLWYKRAKIGWSDSGSKFKIAIPFQFMEEYLEENEVDYDFA